MKDMFLIVAKVSFFRNVLSIEFTDVHEIWGEWSSNHTLIPEIFFMVGRAGEYVIVNYFASIEVTVKLKQTDVEQAIVAKLNDHIAKWGFISGFEPNQEFFDTLDM